MASVSHLWPRHLTTSYGLSTKRFDSQSAYLMMPSSCSSILLYALKKHQT
jgi:hypothetical protein